jgi:hypothetical protein
MKAPEGAFLRPPHGKQHSGFAISKLPMCANFLMFFPPDIISHTITERVAAPVKHVVIPVLIYFVVV